ncbi:MAG: rod shape-determining protein MreD [Alphaproteobacteria bacterium]|nr:rod shape-determining protein MreD [Alphaproteobacteria bacterium]
MITDRFKQIWLLVLAAVPGMLLLLAIILTMAPKHVEGLSRFMPLLYLPVVYYWGMHHARHMPYWLVFAAGLVVDALGGQPMGLHALLLLGFLMAVHRQHRTVHKEGFVLQWAMFAALILGLACCQWVLMMLYYQAYVSPASGVMQWLLTVCLYPLLHQLFDGMNHVLQHRRYLLLHGR